MPRKPTPAKSLLRLLESAAGPVYVLDAQRRIVYGNAAFSAWVGRSVDELVGLRCDYHSSGQVTGSSELAAALCPPPEAFLGRLRVGAVACPSATGELESRAAQFLPLGGIDSSAGVIVAVELAPQRDARSASPESRELSPEQLHHELQRLRSELGRRFHLKELIGQSSAIRQVREQIRLASQARSRVVVTGPPGSGREHVARAIHYNQSPATIGPLAPIDCRLIDAKLLQSTLAAFWKSQAGAPATRSSVLLLDVDQLAADAQQELAGFLLVPGIDLHTLATSRARLQRLAARGKFRGDLAYALSTLTISLPPLSGRTADVPLLAQFFLEETNSRGGKQLSGFTPEALDKLTQYEWPGNVDELAALVGQACEQAAGPKVAVGDLPERIHHAARAVAHERRADESIRLDEFLAEIEKELLQRALRRAKGNKTKAAELLGVNRARLIRRLMQFGLAAPAPADEPIVFEPLPDDEEG